MKNGEGINYLMLNHKTLLNIINNDIRYDSKQIATDIEFDEDEGMFLIQLDDKPEETEE